MARRRSRRKRPAAPLLRLSPPTNSVFMSSLVLIVGGIIAQFADIPVISENAFWCEAVGGVILLLGCLLRGM